MQFSFAQSRVVCFAVMAAMVTACGGGGDGTPTEPTPPPPPSVASVAVTLGVSQLYPGGTTTASSVMRSGAGAVLTGRSVSWISLNSTVATVDQSGNVVAVSPGTATISATSEGQSGSATITVTLAPVAVVSITLGQTTLTVGASTTATVVLRDALNNVLTGRTVTYASSTPSVANIDAGGVVTTVGPGTTTFTATSEGRDGAVTLIVLPPPVASITVSLPQSVVEPGVNVSAIAVLRDAQGSLLTGRTMVWNSSAPNVATVNAAGVVTAIAPGTTSISVASEGKTGAATLTVQLPPITSVTVSGSTRVKVGDTYSYTVTARLANGTMVNRPVTWSTSNAGRAIVSQTGVLTVLSEGAFRLQVTIDGELWFVEETAYDWLSLSGSGSQFVSLDADNTIIGRRGIAEYPQLVISCGSSGSFFVWVRFTNFITSSGTVAMSFDDGSPFSQTWDELSPNFSTLWKPGSNLTVKSFALQLASTRQFGFAFTEYLGSAKAMIFRVTGLSSRLTPLLAACPSNAIVAGGEEGADSRAVMASVVGAGNGALATVGGGSDAAWLSQLLGERALRAGVEASAVVASGDATTLAALRMAPGRVVEQQVARKRR